MQVIWELLVIALATAGVVNTVHTAVVFDEFRNWIIARNQRPDAWWITKWVIRGIQCPDCFAYHVGALMTLLISPWESSSVVLGFAAIWVARHSMPLYAVVMNISPFMQQIARARGGH